VEKPAAEIGHFFQSLSQLYRLLDLVMNRDLAGVIEDFHRASERWAAVDETNRYYPTVLRLLGRRLWLYAEAQNLADVQLSAAHFPAPGWWEIRGTRNVLQFLLELFRGNQESKIEKDDHMRATVLRLFLELSLEANPVIAERIRLARSLGLSSRDIKRLFLSATYRWWDVVDAYQTAGLVINAELFDEEHHRVL
jgi:hypothetical protein